MKKFISQFRFFGMVVLNTVGFWLLFFLMLGIVVMFIPFILVIIAIVAYMYTKNPTSIIDKYEGEAGKMYDNLYDSIFANITCKDVEDFYNQRIEMLKNGNIPWKYETINNFFIDKWRTKWLESMKNDKTMLQMECDEPLCNNKVPREGVVIRKCNDKVSEAFKLKSAAHYNIERKQHDKGETDIEETN